MRQAATLGTGRVSGELDCSLGKMHNFPWLSFRGNCCDFKLENRMYIHVCLALFERYIIYHLFNQVLWFLKEKKPIDGGEGGFTSHRLSRYRDQRSLLFSPWSLNMLIIALNCYHFENNCLHAEFCELEWPWRSLTSRGSEVCNVWLVNNSQLSLFWKTL